MKKLVKIIMLDLLLCILFLIPLCFFAPNTLELVELHGEKALDATRFGFMTGLLFLSLLQDLLDLIFYIFKKLRKKDAVENSEENTSETLKNREKSDII